MTGQKVNRREAECLSIAVEEERGTARSAGKIFRARRGVA
jgi:hypothetical protein